MAAVFDNLPLSKHDSQILQDTLGSLHNISKATRADFLDQTPIDPDFIDKLLEFLNDGKSECTDKKGEPSNWWTRIE